MTLYAPSAYDLIPQMFGLTNSGVTVTGYSIGYNPASYPLWKAFNHSVAGITDIWFVTSKTGWLRVDLGSAKTVVAYTISALPENDQDVLITNTPKEFRLMGVVDPNNAAYDVLLDVQTGIINWAYQEMRTFTLSEPRTYRYYKLSVSDTNNSLFLSIGEWGLLSNEPQETIPTYVTHLSGNVALSASVGGILSGQVQSPSGVGILAALVCSDSKDNIFIPISSFNVNRSSGDATYLQVVIPGMDYAERLA